MSDEPASQTRRFGYVAVVGRPNVGKSTLVNRLVGAKVSIVSRRAQTTRASVLGICTRGHVQAALIDTPGVHEDAARVLNRVMVRNALSAIKNADVGLFLVEASAMQALDRAALERVMRVEKANALPWICCLTKSDLVRPREQLLERIAAAHAIRNWHAIIPLSARKGHGVDDLEQAVSELLPTGPHHFPDDHLSDRSLKFMAAEIIREQLMRQLGDEVPHRTAVHIEAFEESEKIVHMRAVILVEREGQKAIVIGAKGERLKSIGSKARAGLETLLEKKVNLKLWVRVRPNWSNSEKAVRALGIDERL